MRGGAGRDTSHPALSPEGVAIAGARIMSRCAELRTISASPIGYERLYLTPEHRIAADRIASWMIAAGLEARMDAAGNMIGHFGGINPRSPALVLGSHFDTVRDAGSYDGPLGVVTAIETVAALQKIVEAFPFPIEVHAYADEEGTRFRTMLLGSGFVAGLEDASVLTREDAGGVSIAEAMRRFGLDPKRVGAARRSAGDFRAYLEVHIEQGPVLETADLALGTVSAIAGQTRLTVTLSGMAGHAGTVPMSMRRDALAGAAESILAVEAVARARDSVVATVGEIAAEPGASNVISGRVRFTLDLRSGEDAKRLHVFSEIRDRLADIAAKRDLTLMLDIATETEATTTDVALVEAIDAASEAVQGSALRLVSGAGHDAIALSRLCPVGMIFVRCRGGVSHNPAESITGTDAAAGFAALTRTVLGLMERA